MLSVVSVEVGRNGGRDGGGGVYFLPAVSYAFNLAGNANQGAGRNGTTKQKLYPLANKVAEIGGEKKSGAERKRNKVSKGERYFLFLISSTF